jgi:hypothetical protein
VIALSGHASLAASASLLSMTKKRCATNHMNEYKRGLERKDGVIDFGYSFGLLPQHRVWQGANL